MVALFIAGFQWLIHNLIFLKREAKGNYFIPNAKH